MATLQQTYNTAYGQSAQKESIISRFNAWTASQEQNRYGWLAAILATHGCALLPITVLIIALSGNSIALWGVAIGGMAFSLITNLAALPTKITIPVFFFSILVDLTIIGICLGNIISA